jgi:hypothetical protein
LLLLDFPKTVFSTLRAVFLGQEKNTAPSIGIGAIFAKAGALIALLMPFVPTRHAARPDFAALPIRPFFVSTSNAGGIPSSKLVLLSKSWILTGPPRRASSEGRAMGFWAAGS